MRSTPLNEVELETLVNVCCIQIVQMQVNSTELVAKFDGEIDCNFIIPHKSPPPPPHTHTQHHKSTNVHYNSQDLSEEKNMATP